MRTRHILDNPVWSALTGSQQHFSSGHHIKRYAALHAPFIAVNDAESQGSDISEEFTRLAAVDEAVYFMGPAAALPSTFSSEPLPPLVQMICEHALPVSPDEQPISLLPEQAIDDMLNLTALVFPGFFRRRTPELGRYFGIRVAAHLVAMAGERLFAAPYREISGVCTHTDSLGRGYAGQLITHLVNLNLAGEQYRSSPCAPITLARSLSTKGWASRRALRSPSSARAVWARRGVCTDVPSPRTRRYPQRTYIEPFSHSKLNFFSSAFRHPRTDFHIAWCSFPCITFFQKKSALLRRFFCATLGFVQHKRFTRIAAPATPTQGFLHGVFFAAPQTRREGEIHKATAAGNNRAGAGFPFPLVVFRNPVFDHSSSEQ